MEVVAEGVGGAVAEVGLDAAEGEVHLGQLPGGVGELLAVDRDVGALAAVGLHELGRLDEHAARAAGGVVDATLVRLEHLDERLDDRARRVEGAGVLAGLLAGELAEEVLVDAAEHVVEPWSSVSVNPIEPIRSTSCPSGPCRVPRGRSCAAARRGSTGFSFSIRSIAASMTWPISGSLASVLDVLPAGLGGHPEDVVAGVLVAVLEELCAPALVRDVVVADSGRRSRLELLAAGLEAVGDVLEEDQAEDDVLVLGRLLVAAQRVGGVPERLLERLSPAPSPSVPHVRVIAAILPSG